MIKRYHLSAGHHILRQKQTPNDYIPWGDHDHSFPSERIAHTISFTGHRVIAADMLPVLNEQLDAILEEAWQKGWREFMCGGALGFDTICAEAVLRLQLRHPDAVLHLAIPCAEQADRWSDKDRLRWNQLQYLADDVHILSPHYYNGCMQTRNRYMVDRSALVICYMAHTRGGTVSCVGYAVRQDKPVINLAMPQSGAQSYADIVPRVTAEE